MKGTKFVEQVSHWYLFKAPQVLVKRKVFRESVIFVTHILYSHYKRSKHAFLFVKKDEVST